MRVSVRLPRNAMVKFYTPVICIREVNEISIATSIAGHVSINLRAPTEEQTIAVLPIAVLMRLVSEWISALYEKEVRRANEDEEESISG